MSLCLLLSIIRKGNNSLKRCVGRYKWIIGGTTGFLSGQKDDSIDQSTSSAGECWNFPSNSIRLQNNAALEVLSVTVGCLRLDAATAYCYALHFRSEKRVPIVGQGITGGLDGLVTSVFFGKSRRWLLIDRSDSNFDLGVVLSRLIREVRVALISI